MEVRLSRSNFISYTREEIGWDLVQEKKVIIVLNTSLPSFFKENEETTITLWVYLSDLQ